MPLPDVFIENITIRRWAFEMTEMIIAVLIGSVCFVIISSTESIIDVATKYITISATALSFRLICLCVTTLPIPVANDMKKCLALHGVPFLKRLLETYTCGDYMYSGHAAATMIPAYFVVYYTSSYEPVKRWPILALVVILSILSLSGIVISGEHYTIDVIIGGYVGATLCHLFLTKI